MASIANAATGRAYIPQFTMGNSSYVSYYSFSNITGADITVSLKFFDSVNTSGNPTLIQDASTNASAEILRANNAKSYTETASGYSAQFTISAYETVEVILYIGASPYQFGYGTVEWSQNSEVAHAMVANGRMRNADTAYYNTEHQIPIAMGMPF